MLLLRLFRRLAPTLLAIPQLKSRANHLGCSWPFEPTTATWRIQTPFADPATFIFFCLVNLFLLVGSKWHCLVARHATYVAVWVLTSFAQPLFDLRT